MQMIPRSRPLAALSLLALAAFAAPMAQAARTQEANVIPIAALTYVDKAPRGVRSDLLLANDNNVYFGSAFGGDGAGAIGKLTPDGTLTTLRSLKDDGSEGVSIYGALTQGSDNALYGTTFIGGSEGGGTVFRVALDGTLTVLHKFGGGQPNPLLPYTGVTEGPDGFLYGTTLDGGSRNLGVVYRLGKDGTNFSVLHTFAGSNGAKPEGKLVVGADGLLYGTTMIGGDDDRGTIYRITTAGAHEVLYSFPRLGQFNIEGLAVNSTGANPRAGLMRSAIDGNFYGTAYQGGPNGRGTLYRFTPAGQISLVHAFTGPMLGGGGPLAGVVQDASGNFYGTTESGGYRGTGTAYRVSADGTFTMLHAFLGTAVDGSRPFAGLLPAHGKIYAVSPEDGPGSGSGVLVELDSGTGGVPPINLQISAFDVAINTPVTLTWTAPAGWTCSKVAGITGWSGETTTSGTQTLTPGAGTFTFGLNCVEPDDGVEATPRAVIADYTGINVRAPLLQPVDGGGGVGTTSLWLLLLAAALLFVKVKKEFRFPCP